MAQNMRWLMVVSCATVLCACTSYNPNGYMNYQTYTFDNQPLYPENNDDSIYYHQSNASREVSVPSSYYVGGSTVSPVLAKDQDKNWVSKQNPGNYTIELADGDKASQVAGKLFKAPKTNRTAEVRYNRNGTSYYKGLFGTYNSYDAAQQAINSLPDDLKKDASIKAWSQVQSATGTTYQAASSVPAAPSIPNNQ